MLGDEVIEFCEIVLALFGDETEHELRLNVGGLEAMEEHGRHGEVGEGVAFLICAVGHGRAVEGDDRVVALKEIVIAAVAGLSYVAAEVVHGIDVSAALYGYGVFKAVLKAGESIGFALPV